MAKKISDKVQFARLIDEMMAALDRTSTTRMINDMAVSMDLTVAEVRGMLVHAMHTYEMAKPAR